MKLRKACVDGYFFRDDHFCLDLAALSAVFCFLRAWAAFAAAAISYVVHRKIRAFRFAIPARCARELRIHCLLQHLHCARAVQFPSIFSQKCSLLSLSLAPLSLSLSFLLYFSLILTLTLILCSIAFVTLVLLFYNFSDVLR
jgi:hypothetical protein